MSTSVGKVRSSAILALGCCLLLLVASCGNASANGHEKTTKRAASGIVAPASEPDGWSVTYPIKLPSGYTSPTSLHEDQNSAGLWFFARGPKQTLFHWSASSGALSTYTVPSTKPLWAGLWVPIVIDTSGHVWLGINQTLVVVDPSTGSLNTVSLPPVSVGAAGSGLPQGSGADFGSHAGIDALTVDSTGAIVVGREFATELQVVDPATDGVSTIPLPAATAMVGLGTGDLAGFDNGKGIAAALYSAKAVHELGEYANGSWTVSTTPCGAYSVASSAQQLVTAGDGCIASGQPTSSGSVTMSPVQVNGLPEAACATPMGDVTIACLPGGVTAITSTGASPLISLGKAPKGPSSGVGGEASPTPDPHELVPIAAAVSCAGSDGQMWFVPDRGPAEIGLIAHQVS